MPLNPELHHLYEFPGTGKPLSISKIKGLYPCGEGAGYAGGIISAAIDGEKCAAQCVATMS